MKSLAAYAIRGPGRAILVAVGLALVSILFPPLSLLSTAVVALVVLTQDNRDSILIVLGASVLLAVSVYFVWPALEQTGAVNQLLKVAGLNRASFVLAYVLAVWLPTWLAGQWLKQTGSLGQTLLLTGLVGLLGIGVMFVMMGNPTEWWSQYFDQQVIPGLKKEGIEFTDEAAFRQVLTQIASLMTGALMASLVLISSIGVIVGRYWELLLFHSGGFRREFYQLRLGTLAAGLAVGLLVLPLFFGGILGDLVMNASRVVRIIFLFQGLAVCHNLAGRSQNSKVWIILLYILLFLLPMAALFVAILGMLDNWIDIRRRFSGAVG